MINIINNAIKYNVDGGTIAITDKTDLEKYVITISDTGSGMSKALVEDAFDRFKRGNTEENGFGLGLAIVQSIARFHRIDIDIKSEEHKGTSISLFF